jgi:hypothetical protein
VIIGAMTNIEIRKFKGERDKRMRMSLELEGEKGKTRGKGRTICFITINICKPYDISISRNKARRVIFDSP